MSTAQVVLGYVLIALAGLVTALWFPHLWPVAVVVLGVWAVVFTVGVMRAR